MQIVKRFDGSTDFTIMDFKISATLIAGQPVLADTTSTDPAEITNPTTTTLTNCVGLVLAKSSFNPHGGGAGSLTYSTTQASLVEGLVRVVINPDAIFRARMSGGATTGTALTSYTNTSSNAAGTTFTAAISASSFLDGTAWIIAGNNVGWSRRITTYNASTSFVVTVPFPQTISTSDVACIIPYLPAVTTNIQLTSNYLEVNASIAVGTGGLARAVELILNSTTDSYVHFYPTRHAFSYV